MPSTTPYTADLADRDPIEAFRDTTARIRSVAGAWRAADFERTYATGKWTARQILIHLAQSEVALGYRARMTLTSPGYAAQSFDQDQWMAIEAGGSDGSGGSNGSSGMSGHQALDAFLGMAAMNVALFASLSAADRAIALSHPEYGSLTVDWIIHQMAGHQIHHLKQLEAIVGR